MRTFCTKIFQAAQSLEFKFRNFKHFKSFYPILCRCLNVWLLFDVPIGSVNTFSLLIYNHYVFDLIFIISSIGGGKL